MGLSFINVRQAAADLKSCGHRTPNVSGSLVDLLGPGRGLTIASISGHQGFFFAIGLKVKENWIFF